MNNLINTIYYFLRPIIPRRAQIFLRRQLIWRKRRNYSDVWPIFKKAGAVPEGWSGWPEQKQFAVVLTHDVETINGQKKCQNLMALEENLGFRSSFNFVPERYPVSEELRQLLVSRGFEVGVHGLIHDGKLYRSRELFQKRVLKINNYIKKWNAVGFRSPSMHYNLDWIHELNIEYDASTFDTDPFEQSDGVHTIFPFFVQSDSVNQGYVELPYTLPQDFSLFILMKEKTIDIWKKKLDWIAEQGGMALVNVHPDYMNFDGKKPGLEEFPYKFYTELLEYIEHKYNGRYWHVLPKEVARFYLAKTNKDRIVKNEYTVDKPDRRPTME